MIVESEDRKYNFDVVDGQQRLTTLYIILKSIKKDLPKYTISYETRDKSEEYLENILKNHDKNFLDNIDYFHMHLAKQVVEDFFNKKGNSDDTNDIYKDLTKESWYKKLTDDETGAFFIEYKVVKEMDSRSTAQIFKGLNDGKIPLTNAELIKGLILRESNYQEEKYKFSYVETAQEWDRIEKRLREPNLWAWLGQEKIDSPHIDFIFNIVAAKIKQDNKNLDTQKNVDRQLNSYDIFSNYLKVEYDNKNLVHKLWQEIKQCVMTIEDWYEDISTYHLLGYLNISNFKKKTKKDIKDYYLEYLKSDVKNSSDMFINNIKSNLLKDFSDKDINQKFKKDDINVIINDLSYESGEKVKKVLILFNLLTCIKHHTRFNFNKYYYKKDGKKEQYDIEHIIPSCGHDDFANVIKRKEWINAVNKSNLFDKIELSDDEIENADKFKEVFNNIVNKNYSKEDMDDDSIGNLCLLDATTNRGYGNYPFPYKVKKITESDSDQSVFILPCTKNVFLKYYSGLNINNFIWTKEDSEKYKQAIIDIITEYIK